MQKTTTVNFDNKILPFPNKERKTIEKEFALIEKKVRKNLSSKNKNDLMPLIESYERLKETLEKIFKINPQVECDFIFDFLLEKFISPEHKNLLPLNLSIFVYILKNSPSYQIKYIETLIYFLFDKENKIPREKIMGFLSNLIHPIKYKVHNDNYPMFIKVIQFLVFEGFTKKYIFPYLFQLWPLINPKDYPIFFFEKLLDHIVYYFINLLKQSKNDEKNLWIKLQDLIKNYSDCLKKTNLISQNYYYLLVFLFIISTIYSKRGNYIDFLSFTGFINDFWREYLIKLIDDLWHFHSKNTKHILINPIEKYYTDYEILFEGDEEKCNELREIDSLMKIEDDLIEANLPYLEEKILEFLELSLKKKFHEKKNYIELQPEMIEILEKLKFRKNFKNQIQFLLNLTQLLGAYFTSEWKFIYEIYANSNAKKREIENIIISIINLIRIGTFFGEECILEKFLDLVEWFDDIEVQKLKINYYVRNKKEFEEKLPLIVKNVFYGDIKNSFYLMEKFLFYNHKEINDQFFISNIQSILPKEQFLYIDSLLFDYKAKESYGSFLLKQLLIDEKNENRFSTIFSTILVKADKKNNYINFLSDLVDSLNTPDLKFKFTWISNQIYDMTKTLKKDDTFIQNLQKFLLSFNYNKHSGIYINERKLEDNDFTYFILNYENSNDLSFYYPYIPFNHNNVYLFFIDLLNEYIDKNILEIILTFFKRESQKMFFFKGLEIYRLAQKFVYLQKRKKFYSETKYRKIIKLMLDIMQNLIFHEITQDNNTNFKFNMYNTKKYIFDFIYEGFLNIKMNLDIIARKFEEERETQKVYMQKKKNFKDSLMSLIDIHKIDVDEEVDKEKEKEKDGHKRASNKDDNKYCTFEILIDYLLQFISLSELFFFSFHNFSSINNRNISKKRKPLKNVFDKQKNEPNIFKLSKRASTNLSTKDEMNIPFFSLGEANRIIPHCKYLDKTLIHSMLEDSKLLTYFFLFANMISFEPKVGFAIIKFFLVNKELLISSGGEIPLGIIYLILSIGWNNKVLEIKSEFEKWDDFHYFILYDINITVENSKKHELGKLENFCDYVFNYYLQKSPDSMEIYETIINIFNQTTDREINFVEKAKWNVHCRTMLDDTYPPNLEKEDSTSAIEAKNFHCLTIEENKPNQSTLTVQNAISNCKLTLRQSDKNLINLNRNECKNIFRQIINKEKPHEEEKGDNKEKFIKPKVPKTFLFQTIFKGLSGRLFKSMPINWEKKNAITNLPILNQFDCLLYFIPFERNRKESDQFNHKNEFLTFANSLGTIVGDLSNKTLTKIIFQDASQRILFHIPENEEIAKTLTHIKYGVFWMENPYSKIAEESIISNIVYLILIFPFNQNHVLIMIKEREENDKENLNKKKKEIYDYLFKKTVIYIGDGYELLCSIIIRYMSFISLLKNEYSIESKENLSKSLTPKESEVRNNIVISEVCYNNMERRLELLKSYEKTKKIQPTDKNSPFYNPIEF